MLRQMLCLSRSAAYGRLLVLVTVVLGVWLLFPGIFRYLALGYPLTGITHHFGGPDGRVKVYSKSSLHRNSDDVALVAPKANWDQVEWIEKFCETFKCTPNIYTMDANPEDGYLIPRTIQGHEAAAYLTYIVDNYDSLAPFTLFVHGGEDHWHNDMAGPKTYHALYSLRLEAVKAYGYANLRCLWTPGCPDTLHPSIIQKSDEAYEYLVDMFPEIYSELFGVNETEVPQKFAHQCCAQFAVTRERIRERPLSDYERILNWVENTHVTDSYGIGWTVEKIWHILFVVRKLKSVVETFTGGVAPVHLPSGNLCNLSVGQRKVFRDKWVKCNGWG